MKFLWLLFTTVGYLTHFTRIDARLRSAASSKTTSSVVSTPRKLQTNASVPITFSEYPLRTVITNQYALTNGVIFGNNAEIINDTASPTTPTLSSPPNQSGNITGRFVRIGLYGTLEDSFVSSFTFTIGFLDRNGSTRAQWFDPTGAVIGQLTNGGSGIRRFTISTGNIASFNIGILNTEPNGFSIDNFASTVGTSGILFRELRAEAHDGSWGPSTLNIPGFDHVALSYLESVFEAHPGYPNGTYVAENGSRNKSISTIRGVQSEHTRETFRHYSRIAFATNVTNFKEIPITDSVALALRNIIATRIRSAGFLGFATIEEFVATHQPDAQKGRNNTFTGVGLIEWAAEQAGINGGQGFIPNGLESITSNGTTYPLLSPELMYYALQNQLQIFNLTQTIKAFFDPVNYYVTDPLGRRSGNYDFPNRTQFTPIPNAQLTKQGDLETLIVQNPVPGEYKLEVSGIPGKKGIAALEVSGRPSVNIRTTGNETTVQTRSVDLPVVSGSRGDVNGDGKIDQTDLNVLRSQITRNVDGFANVGDLDANGLLDAEDVRLLSLLLVQTRAPTRAPTKAPTRAPIRVPVAVPVRPPTNSPVQVPISAPSPPVTQDGPCPRADICGNGLFGRRYTLNRGTGSGCTQRCVRALFVRFRLRQWNCGTCDL